MGPSSFSTVAVIAGMEPGLGPRGRPKVGGVGDCLGSSLFFLWTRPIAFPTHRGESGHLQWPAWRLPNTESRRSNVWRLGANIWRRVTSPARRAKRLKSVKFGNQA